jgi:serine/threonine-protein kinase
VGDKVGQIDRLKTALADRYAIERELGAGGMATVYLAEDLKHRRAVAVKVLRPELAAAIGPERFLREIEITARLDHPHILPLLDSGEADGFLFYIMPYVQGESLRDRLNREKQLPIDDAIQIAREVADALDFAHQQDVVHRDIKPENVLLGAGHARVADFGIARALSAAGGDRLTETGAAIGTPHYMSPEQASGGQQVDGRTDIYALACVLYEMLGGDPPFTGSSAQAVLTRKVVDQVPSLRTLRDTVSEPVEGVVMKALAKAPADRHGTAGQMAEELRRATREEVVQGTGRLRRRVGHRAALVLPVLAAVTVVLWLGFKTVGRDELPITHLAILPLENLTGDTELEYLVDGIHSELIAVLGRIPELTVISRSSVMPFKDEQEALRNIAAELNVQALVEGSVFLAGDTVRVMAQLVRAVPEERQLWAESYDGSLASPLALLDRMAGAIAEQIQVTLTAEYSRPSAERAVDSEAYHLVKKGEHQNRMGWIREAEASFQQALGRDSTYAPAHVGLASTYNGEGYFHTALPEDAYPRARAAALKALEFDSTLAEAHEQLAWTRAVFDWDWSGAEDELRHALSLNPGSALGHAWYAFLLHWQRRYEEAITELDRALELDPLSVAMRLSAANMFRRMRQCDRAIEEAHEASKLERELHVQGPRDPRFVIGLCYLQQGRSREAMPLLEAGAERAMPRYAARYKAELAHAYGVTGSRSAALVLLADVLALTRSQYVPPYLVAMIYTGLGDKDSAFSWLGKAVDVRDNWLAFVNVEPRWDLLRSDQRFSLLLSHMNFPK